MTDRSEYWDEVEEMGLSQDYAKTLIEFGVFDDPKELVEALNEGSYQTPIRNSFSIHHLQTSIILAEDVRDLENKYADTEEFLTDEDGFNIAFKHRGFVAQGIISITAFLEALVNETYEEMVKDALVSNGESPTPDHAIPHEDNFKLTLLDDDQYSESLDLIFKLEEIAGESFSRLSTLKRYQLILAYLGQDTFDPGRQPYQNVKEINRLRNYFVHYQPEWIDFSENESHHLTGALKGEYSENPLADDDLPFFPLKALSHGCLEWAISNSIRFTDEFFGRIDTEPKYRDLPVLKNRGYL